MADAASERFSEESAKWDQKPSTVSVTKAVSAAMRQMSWFKNIKEDSGAERVRAMDFGCGTGFLTQHILDNGVFKEVTRWIMFEFDAKCE